MMALADLLNEVVNSPGVVENVAPGYRHVDLSGFARDPSSVISGDENGMVIFADKRDGTFEVHYLIPPRTRGREVMRIIRRAVELLFTTTDAEAIVGETPRDNIRARIVNIALGGAPVGESIDTCGRSCTSYRLERETWARLSEDSSEA